MSYHVVPGFNGTLDLYKQADGTALAKLTLTGMVPDRRYFGNISIGGTGTVSSTSIYADLKECTSGYSETWLYQDSENNPIFYDSLLVKNLFIRIVEVIPGSKVFNDVLRGDMGSNLISGDFKEYPIESVNENSFSGKVTFRSRLNGTLIVDVSVSGPGTNLMPVRLMRGEPELYETSKLITDLTSQIPGTSVTTELTGFVGGLASLDTIKAYIAISFKEIRKDSIVAVSLLGSNQYTGQERNVDLYSFDSSRKATLRLRENKAGIWKPSIIMGSMPGYGPYFLSLQKGVVDFQSYVVNTLYVAKQLLFSNRTTAWARLVLNNRAWTPDSLNVGDYHLRIDSDTNTFLTTGLPQADLGYNAFDGAEKSFKLQTNGNPAYPNYTGSVRIRRRVNGNCLMQVKLDQSQQGIAFQANLFSGSFTPGENPIPANLTDTLGVIQGTGTATSQWFEPKGPSQIRGLPYSLFTSGKFIDVQSDDPVRVCAGNIP